MSHTPVGVNAPVRSTLMSMCLHGQNTGKTATVEPGCDHEHVRTVLLRLDWSTIPRTVRQQYRD